MWTHRTLGILSANRTTQREYRGDTQSVRTGTTWCCQSGQTTKSMSIDLFAQPKERNKYQTLLRLRRQM